jgi:hypothetical protein
VGSNVLSIEKNRSDNTIEVVTEVEVWNLKPDFSCPSTVPMGGVIVTRASPLWNYVFSAVFCSFARITRI